MVNKSVTAMGCVYSQRTSDLWWEQVQGYRKILHCSTFWNSLWWNIIRGDLKGRVLMGPCPSVRPRYRSDSIR
ncbi:hypothetical protein OSTOST_22692 [Ostertagia ostertagi]